MPWGFPGGPVVKNLPANTEDKGHAGSIPGSEISPGRRNCSLLQYSFLKNLIDRETWWTTVHRVSKSQTQLSMPALYNAIKAIEGNIWKLSFTSESFFLSFNCNHYFHFNMYYKELTKVHGCVHARVHTHTQNTLCLLIFCPLTCEDDTRTTSVSHYPATGWWSEGGKSEESHISLPLPW